MKKENKMTVTALSTTKDLATLPILKQLDEKIAAMKRIEDSVYRTTGNLDGYPNIKTETKVDNLYRALGTVIGMSSVYQQAVDRLNRSSAPQFTICGGTLEDWTADIQLRIDIIEQDSKLQALKTAKEKMEKFLSEEDQKRMVLQELEGLLS